MPEGRSGLIHRGGGLQAGLRLARPGQWAKSILVVSVPLLDLETWDPEVIWRVGWAAAAFIVASSMVYITNDILDRERDRRHPTKRLRPIAAGRISTRAALLLTVAHVPLLAGLLSLEPVRSGWPVLAYLLLSAAYNLALKHLPLIDVFVVAAGFGLRLVLGYLAIGADVSGWLLTCVFCLCLLLVVGKRRRELTTAGATHRPALRGYTVPLTDQLMLVSAVLTVGCYLLYIRTEAPVAVQGLAATAALAPLVLFALFRYLQLVMVHEGGEDPARTLFKDPALVLSSLLWVLVSVVLLALPLQWQPA